MQVCMCQNHIPDITVLGESERRGERSRGKRGALQLPLQAHGARPDGADLRSQTGTGAGAGGGVRVRQVHHHCPPPEILRPYGRLSGQ